MGASSAGVEGKSPAPSLPLTPWAELDLGERGAERFDRLGNRVLEDSSDEDDLQREEESDVLVDDENTEIATLRRRRAYIIAQLHNVGKSIRETEADVLEGQCLPEIPRRDLAPKNTVDESQTGSFLHAVNWRAGTDDGPGPKPLTDRAAERAGALLRLFDADGDGCLSFDEFRAYLVRLGRDKGKLGERLTTNREFWLNYVMDQAGPPGASDVGGMISFDGTRLTRSGFISHRRMVEREHPLELDLLSLGLDLLPESLQRWLKAKDAFDRIDAESVSSAAERGERGENDQERDGSVDRGEAQLLLADAGEIMSHLRIEEELSLATIRSKVLLQLVQERRKRNSMANTQALSRAAAFDSQRIYRAAWLSWFLSGRVKEEHETSWLEKSLIRIKTSLFRGFRTFYSWVGYPRRALEHLAQQGLISSGLLASFKGSDARATLRAAIGDAEDDGRGFSISLNFIHKGNVTVTNLPDKSQVLRVALFWRAQANIDFQCRQLKLGLRPSDLVRELTVSFFCPLRLSQILESKRTVLNDRLKVSFSAEGCFCGPLVAKLMEETLAGMIDDAHQAAADSVEHDLDRAARAIRTANTVPGMRHPLVAPKRKLDGLASSQSPGGRTVKNKSVSSSTAGATSAATGSLRTARGRLRTDSEKRHEEAKAKRWLDGMWSFAAKLRGVKTFALDLEAGSPLEFLDSSWARTHLPACWRSEEAFTTPGYAAGWFGAWKRSLSMQASRLGERARQHLANSRASQEAAEKKAAAMADTDEGRRLAGLEEELARLGVSKELLAETMGEQEEETARRLREAKEKQMEEYADLEDALRACTKFLLGPRELRVQSGPNVLAVEMQGLDIFDALSVGHQGAQGGEGEDGTSSKGDSAMSSACSTADSFEK
eukprot:g10621.t1